MENQTITISKEEFTEKAAKVTDIFMNKFSDTPKAAMIIMLSTVSFTADLMEELFKEESDARC